MVTLLQRLAGVQGGSRSALPDTTSDKASRQEAHTDNAEHETRWFRRRMRRWVGIDRPTLTRVGAEPLYVRRC
jgi:hypothetical protein